ncbi:MAG: AMP-binding protein [Syntrophales bacterium]|nr:AMP-binding protein [Syntrophales bacterium]
MRDIREEWKKVILKWKLNPDKPANDKYWSPELETCSRDKIKEIQSEKLEVLVRYLYECTSFYHEKFKKARLTPKDIKSIEDLVKIPLTTKTEMAEDVEKNPPWGTYSPITDDIWTKRGWMFFNTSGTTAAPRAFRHSLHDLDMWRWLDARGLWAMGVKPGDSVMVCFGYGPHVAFWGIHYSFQLIGCGVISGGGLDTRRRALFIKTYKPTILGCTPSYASYLGRTMEEMGYDPRESSIRIIVTGGEPGCGIPSTKKRIEELWNAKLAEFFGCTEASPAPGGYMCEEEIKQTDRPASDHLMEDGQIWELVDDKNFDPVSEGERGLGVVTNLYSESPLLRFMVGDYSVFNSGTCPCGRTHKKAIGGFAGRADDMLNIKGVTLFPSAIEDVVRGIDEIGDEFQIVITTEKDMDQFTIVAEPKPSIPKEDYPKVQNKIINEIAAKLELRPNVDLKPYGTLPRTEFKAKRVKDLRKKI